MRVRKLNEMTGSGAQFKQVHNLIQSISKEGKLIDPAAFHLTKHPFDSALVLPLTVANLNTNDFCTFFFPGDKVTSIGRQLRFYKASIAEFGPQDTI